MNLRNRAIFEAGSRYFIQVMKMRTPDSRFRVSEVFAAETLIALLETFIQVKFKNRVLLEAIQENICNGRICLNQEELATIKRRFNSLQHEFDPM